MTSVLAMLYLVLFASLAVGFYAATNTAVQIAANERHVRQAMLSTESGMEFMRLVLGNVELPARTSADQVWTKLCQQVAAQIDRTPNFGNANITPPSSGVTTWTLPTLTMPGGGQCSVTLAPKDGSAENIDVTVTGIEPDLRTDKSKGTDPLRRKIRLTYVKGPRASEIFDYGVASRSAISMSGKAQITGAAGDLARGSVLSATANPVPLSMTGNPVISGDFSYTNPNGKPSFGNGTIAGYKSSESDFANHIHSGVREPAFPLIDSSSFEKFVPKPTDTGASVIATNPPSTRKSFTNIRIKANANPSFAAGTVIQGVVFIETPNQITFTGGVTIQGVIVVDQSQYNGTVNTNTIRFGGNITHQGVETIPDAPPFVVTVPDATDPSKSQVIHLPQLTGSFLLAPGFGVTMTGNSNSVGGTIVTSKLDISGTAGANVKGTVINLDDTAVNMTGTSDIIIRASGSGQYPAGITFGSHFTPNPATYLELQ
jgi:hypothetical protein